MFNDIIWDFDGTLIDTYPGMVEAFLKSLKDEGIEGDSEEILKYMKISQRHAINYYIEKFNLGEDFITRFAKYEEEIEDCKRIPYEGIIDICGKVVKSGRRNYIVTHRDNSTFKVLKYHGMLELFAEIVVKQNGFKRKPDPEAFTYIVDKYKLDKSKTLGVGDRELDIAAAHNAGIKTCLFKSEEVDCAVEPDYIINSIYELEKIIF